MMNEQLMKTILKYRDANAALERVLRHRVEVAKARDALFKSPARQAALELLNSEGRLLLSGRRFELSYDFRRVYHSETLQIRSLTEEVKLRVDYHDLDKTEALSYIASCADLSTRDAERHLTLLTHHDLLRDHHGRCWAANLGLLHVASALEHICDHIAVNRARGVNDVDSLGIHRRDFEDDDFFKYRLMDGAEFSTRMKDAYRELTSTLLDVICLAGD